MGISSRAKDQTDTEGQTYYMIQLWIGWEALAETVEMLDMDDASDHDDLGYAAHMALAELFGDHEPRPFCVYKDNPERGIQVMGYTEVSRDRLMATAKINAAPVFFESAGLDGMAVKQMPTELPEGMTVHFELTACPAYTLGQDVGRFSKGSEVDAWRRYFIPRKSEGKPIEKRKDEVYIDWLKHQFDVRGGAVVEDAWLCDADTVEVVRRHQGGERTIRRIQKPRAEFRGTLRITEPEAFDKMMVSGVGRHKSFGFGMLRLRADG
jgi:CRISPR system Cascade subunit CasE